MGKFTGVLLVEDEQDLRWMWTAFLESHSVKVIGANNGVAGLRLYAKYRDRIMLVITDHHMPIMDGATMVGRIREIDPKVKVLAVSSHEEWPEGVDRLPKPFDLDELLHKIQSYD